jgi:hypothetical protein
MAADDEIRGDSPGGGTAPRIAGDLLAMESPVVQADEAAIARRFGKGRPPGAKNIATRQRLMLFEQIAGDQLLASARLLTIPLESLRRMLGCDLLEAAEFQRKVRADVMPYLYSKQPLAVAVSGKVATFNVSVPMPGGGAAIGPQAIMDLLAGQLAAEIAEGFDPHAGGEIARLAPPEESEDETTA